jgi:hypothetical protein
VGFLVKNDLLHDFRFEIVDTSYQGILWGKLSSKAADFALLPVVCYLPPERSVWADSDAFFNALTCQIHQYQNDGFLMIGGDFNARCGNKADYIEGADDVSPREVLDLQKKMPILIILLIL